MYFKDQEDDRFNVEMVRFTFLDRMVMDQPRNTLRQAHLLQIFSADEKMGG